jgi:uncharacterized membrane protein YgcG
VRPVARLFVAILVAAVPVGFALVSCGTDAQNIQACRDIENARCEAAPACTPGFDPAACKRFYRDACLVGTSDTDADAGTPDAVSACVTAIQACGAADGGTTCPGQTLRDGALCQMLNPDQSDAGPRFLTLDPTPCNIILHCPEVLSACAWVGSIQPPVGDGGTDGGDAGSDGGTGGTGTGGSGTGGGGKGGGTGGGL